MKTLAEYQLESDTKDYLDLGIRGLKTHKVKDQNIIIIHFHSSEYQPSKNQGLLQAVVFYALHLGKGNRVVLYTCHSAITFLSKWIRENAEVIEVEGIIYTEYTDYNRHIKVMEKGKDKVTFEDMF